METLGVEGISDRILGRVGAAGQGQLGEDETIERQGKDFTEFVDDRT